MRPEHSSISISVQANEVYKPISRMLAEARGRAIWRYMRVSTSSTSTRPKAIYGTNVRIFSDVTCRAETLEVGDEVKPIVVTPAWRSWIT